MNSEIHCSHTVSYFEVILWYKQDEHNSLKYLEYLNRQFPTIGSDMEGKITLKGDGSKYCTLTVSKLLFNDSGVYFCAASRQWCKVSSSQYNNFPAKSRQRPAALTDSDPQPQTKPADIIHCCEQLQPNHVTLLNTYRIQFQSEVTEIRSKTVYVS